MTEINKYRGVAKLNIYGEDRYFKFGTAHMALLCDVLDKPMKEVIELLDDKSNLKVQIYHYYCAAVCYVRLHNAESTEQMKEPTYDQVANWFDEIAAEHMEKINEAAFAQAFPNAEAPKMKEETQGQS